MMTYNEESKDWNTVKAYAQDLSRRLEKEASVELVLEALKMGIAKDKTKRGRTVYSALEQALGTVQGDPEETINADGPCPCGGSFEFERTDGEGEHFFCDKCQKHLFCQYNREGTVIA